MIDYVLSNYPIWSFGCLLFLIILLTVIDKEVKIKHEASGGVWVISALGASASFRVQGIPFDVTAEFASWIYFGVIVGSGFRPGLITRLPFRNVDGKWLHYGNLYILTGWIGLIWAGSVALDLLEPYTLG